MKRNKSRKLNKTTKQTGNTRRNRRKRTKRQKQLKVAGWRGGKKSEEKENDLPHFKITATYYDNKNVDDRKKGLEINVRSGFSNGDILSQVDELLADLLESHVDSSNEHTQTTTTTITLNKETE